MWRLRPLLMCWHCAQNSQCLHVSKGHNLLYLLTHNVNTDFRSGDAVDIFSLKRGNNLIWVQRALGKTRPKATHFLVTGRKLLHGWVSYEIIKIWQIGKTGGFSHRTGASHDMWREGDWLRANQNPPTAGELNNLHICFTQCSLDKEGPPYKMEEGWVNYTDSLFQWTMGVSSGRYELNSWILTLVRRP